MSHICGLEELGTRYSLLAMREIDEVQPIPKGGKLRLFVAMLATLVLGGVAGALIFPVIEVQRVEVPVQVIKYVDRQVPVDKIIDRVVEKRIEVPVEVIKYVDRMVPVEKIVEKIVEKRVEVPVEVIKYVDRFAPGQSEAKRRNEPATEMLDSGFRFLRIGMGKAEVVALIGMPYFDDGAGAWYYYSVESRVNVNLKFADENVTQIISPK